MSRAELLHDIRIMSSGTIANLIDDCRYKAIDAAQAAWLDIAAEELTDDEISGFESCFDFVSWIRSA